MSNFLLFHSTSSISWVKEKSEASAQRLVEAVQAHNNISKWYNELKASTDLMESENARLTKKLKESDATFLCGRPN